MPNSKHLTHGISNLVSLITKTKLGLSVGEVDFEEKACFSILSSLYSLVTESLSISGTASLSGDVLS
jgi:hypothetical protein